MKHILAAIYSSTDKEMNMTNAHFVWKLEIVGLALPLLAAVALADVAIPDHPPEVGLAVLSEDGSVVVHVYSKDDSRPELVVPKRDGGPPLRVQVDQRDVWTTNTRVYPITSVDFRRLDGSEIASDELMRLLMKPRAVIIQNKQQQVDVMFRSLFRDDAMVLRVRPAQGDNGLTPNRSSGVALP